jgi:hypothetical protein
MRSLLVAGAILVCIVLAFVLFRLFGVFRDLDTRLVGNPLQPPVTTATLPASPGAFPGGVLEPGVGTPVPTTEPLPSPAVSPSPSPVLGETYVVTGTDGQGLFLRQEPSISAATIGSLADGTVVTSINEELFYDGARNWRQVDTPRGQGWVADSFLRPVPPGPPANGPATDPEPTAIVQPADNRYVVSGTDGAGLLLRREPSSEADTIGTVPEGEVVKALDDGLVHDGTREWRRVRTSVGDGWVADEFLRPAP